MNTPGKQLVVKDSFGGPILSLTFETATQRVAFLQSLLMTREWKALKVKFSQEPGERGLISLDGDVVEVVVSRTVDVSHQVQPRPGHDGRPRNKSSRLLP